MTEAATGEVKWTASYPVNPADTDLQMQQSRLAAGVGHALALRINELLNADTRSSTKSKVVIEQATAHINQTSPERFQAAQAMLEKALAEDPGNVEIQVALAALLMRGVQMVWLSPAEREPAETKAEALLEQTLRAKPNYIPAHEAYCRFLNATNQFSASLVACAQSPELRSVERDRAVSCRPCPDPDRTLRGRAGDVQAGGPLRYPAGLALDVDARRRLGQYADGPRRRRRAVAAASRSRSRPPAAARTCCWRRPISNWERPRKRGRRWKRAANCGPARPCATSRRRTKNSSPVYIEAAERIMRVDGGGRLAGELRFHRGIRPIPLLQRGQDKNIENNPMQSRDVPGIAALFAATVRARDGPSPYFHFARAVGWAKRSVPTISQRAR